MSRQLFCAVIMLLGTQAAMAKDDGWQSLFNGKDLTGWTPKFVGQDLGMDYQKTFRVEEGVLKVDYSNYTSFDGKFGHLFYETPFSFYRLRLEYRFYGDQVKSGPAWAFRNSGVMIHSQDPRTMATEQAFPVSIEVQFLGQEGEGMRPTGNLCTPGTHVEMSGKLITAHCTASSSATFDGDGWVQAQVDVRPDGTITHFIDGKQVLRYEATQYDPTDADAKKLIVGDMLALTRGYIALQAESHPLEFRNIEIQRLEK